MSNLSHRLGIAISVSILAVVLPYPVIAKPQQRSKPVLTSQVTTKTAVVVTGSRQPTEAILANIRLKSSTPTKLGKASIRSVVMIKPVARKAKAIKHISADRFSQGTDTFTRANQPNRRTNKSSGIDRWVD